MEAQKLRTNKKSEVRWILFSLHCIKKRAVVTLTSDIMAEVYKLKPDLPKDPKSRNKHMVSLSLAMSRLEDSGELKSIKYIGERSRFYGLPEWFDEFGKIKDGYDLNFFE